MTYYDAFMWVYWGLIGATFVIWYLCCWYWMLIQAPTILSYFTPQYESAPFFMVVNFIIVVFAPPFYLVWVMS